jgi:phosphatidyl-myo-inositol dimannoside synthase
MRRHLLVTNDFPPKIGGIQNYLWELWRRLPNDSFVVYTTSYEGSATFDAQQPFRVERAPQRFLAPSPGLIDRVNGLARAVDADLVLLDPALPLGLIGPHLDRPFGIVLHGAEVTIPGRIPVSRAILARTLRAASLIIAAGRYPLAEAERCAGRQLPAIVVPPGVDPVQFRPFDDEERQLARRGFRLAEDQFVVATVNRLVARKGLDVLIRAAATLAGQGMDLRVMIGGTGRQHHRLARLIDELRAPVELLGRLSTEDVGRLYGAADAMAMLCHNRWLGLEQEGFGIVFLEAAAAGIPQVAGWSGGAHEAVEDGVTGIVIDQPRDHLAVARTLQSLHADPDWCHKLGQAARARVCSEFDYDLLALELQSALDHAIKAVPRPGGSLEAI